MLLQSRFFRYYPVGASPPRSAPDIVEAIVRGDEPDGLSLAQLVNDLAMAWHEQRAQLGMPGPESSARSPSGSSVG